MVKTAVYCVISVMLTRTWDPRSRTRDVKVNGKNTANSDHEIDTGRSPVGRMPTGVAHSKIARQFKVVVETNTNRLIEATRNKTTK